MQFPGLEFWSDLKILKFGLLVFCSNFLQSDFLYIRKNDRFGLFPVGLIDVGLSSFVLSSFGLFT